MAMRDYGSIEEWQRDVMTVGGEPRDEHHVTADGRVLDTNEKTLAWLVEIGALPPDAASA